MLTDTLTVGSSDNEYRVRDFVVEDYSGPLLYL